MDEIFLWGVSQVHMNAGASTVGHSGWQGLHNKLCSSFLPANGGFCSSRQRTETKVDIFFAPETTNFICKENGGTRVYGSRDKKLSDPETKISGK